MTLVSVIFYTICYCIDIYKRSKKCKVRIDSRNIKKFRKRKTYSEVVKKKETERKDEKVLYLEMIKENLLLDEVLQPCVLSPPLARCDSSVFKNSSD